MNYFTIIKQNRKKKRDLLERALLTSNHLKIESYES